MTEHLMISTTELHFNARPLPIGSTSNLLTITGYVRLQTGPCSKVGYVCRCACGKICVKRGGDFAGQLSCGCKKKPMAKRGHSYNYKPILYDATGRKRAEHRAWAALIQRCTNPNLKGWENYGGRGIRFCKRWRKFENFLADMGERPSPKHSLDRINVDGNYEPSNCRWATRQEQALNKRNTRLFTLDGKTFAVTGWSDYLGISVATFLWRIERYGYEGAIRMGGATPHRDKKTVNVTGLRGVGKAGERFFAQIAHAGRVIYLGRFDTAEAAHQAYLQAREVYDSGVA